MNRERPECAYAIAWIRERVEHGYPLAETARAFAQQHPRTTLDVMEQIGCEPSSELELRALQLAFEKELPREP